MKRKKNAKRGKSTASLVLGIVGVVFSAIPLLGLPINLLGLLIGLKAKKHKHSKHSKRTAAGIVLSLVGLGIAGAAALFGAVWGLLAYRKQITPATK